MAAKSAQLVAAGLLFGFTLGATIADSAPTAAEEAVTTAPAACPVGYEEYVASADWRFGAFWAHSGPYAPSREYIAERWAAFGPNYGGSDHGFYYKWLSIPADLPCEPHLRRWLKEAIKAGDVVFPIPDDRPDTPTYAVFAAGTPGDGIERIVRAELPRRRGLTPAQVEKTVMIFRMRYPSLAWEQ